MLLSVFQPDSVEWKRNNAEIVEDRNVERKPVQDDGNGTGVHDRNASALIHVEDNDERIVQEKDC